VTLPVTVSTSFFWLIARNWQPISRTCASSPIHACSALTM
jgi:hypothetical protein